MPAISYHLRDKFYILFYLNQNHTKNKNKIKKHKIKKFYFFLKIVCHQDLRYIHALIVFAGKLHLLCVIRSVPLENTLSIETLVA